MDRHKRNMNISVLTDNSNYNKNVTNTILDQDQNNVVSVDQSIGLETIGSMSRDMFCSVAMKQDCSDLSITED